MIIYRSNSIKKLSTTFLVMAALFVVAQTSLATEKGPAKEGEQPYIKSLTIKSPNKKAALRAFLDTLNTYGYMIGTVNLEEGLADGYLINYASFREADHYSGITNLNKITQKVETKISPLSNGELTVQLRIIFGKKIVHATQPYDTFFAQMRKSRHLKVKE